MILVTAATGNVGGELVTALCRAGREIRALVRSPEKADNLRGYDCDIAVGDFADPESLEEALEDVDRVFLASPAVPEQPDLEGAVIDAVVRTGGAHVVKLAIEGWQ